MDYKKMSNENENQYVLRICSMKEQNSWTWEDIAKILNDSLGNNYGESAYRKRYQHFQRMMTDNETNLFNEDKYLNSVREAKIELEKERQKLYATKVEMQRLIRQEARFEMFYENVKNAIETLPMPEIKREFDSIDNEKAYVLCFADIHAGAKFELPTNSYSIEECERRFNVLLEKTVQYVKKNDIPLLHVVSLGDDIQGILRVSDLQLNETTVVEATVFVARMIANFLNELSAYCYVDYYHTPSSNHSQTRPIGTKASELASEDIEYVIGNYIADMLMFNSRVDVNNNFGHDYIEIPVFDYNIVAMHGHTVNNVETVLKDMSTLHGKLVDFVILGHLHTGKSIQGNERGKYDTEVLMCPSFQGTDPFAYKKLGKSSKAACKLFVFDQEYGCTGTEKFILN